MPFYDYKCPRCNNIVEIYKKISEYDREELCKICNIPMNQIINSPLLEFKGDCWAKDGYSRTDKKNTAKEGE